MSETKSPILFTYRDLLAGNGFVAGVEIKGRYLMSEENGEVWVDGVEPGGIGVGGGSQKEAAAAFRQMYQKVLFDIALEAKTFDKFKAEVEKFFRDVNEPISQEWWNAVKLVRKGRVTSEWLGKESADSEMGVHVIEIAMDQEEAPSVKQKPEPSYNAPEQGSLAA